MKNRVQIRFLSMTGCLEMPHPTLHRGQGRNIPELQGKYSFFGGIFFFNGSGVLIFR